MVAKALSVHRVQMHPITVRSRRLSRARIEREHLGAVIIDVWRHAGRHFSVTGFDQNVAGHGGARQAVGQGLSASSSPLLRVHAESLPELVPALVLDLFADLVKPLA